MLKNFTYKIIAIASLLLGLLGPQVASGQEQAAVHDNLHPTSAAQAIPVVSNPQQDIAVEVGTQKGDCSSDSSARLDLLLWQACDFSIQTQVAVVPPKVVVNDLDLSGLNVKVAVSPNWQNPPSLNSSSDQNKEAVLVSSAQDLTKTILTKYNSVEFLAEADGRHPNFSFNNYASMVMRC
jgi:hypothetical protein